MSDQVDQNREHEVRERIVNLIRANEQASKPTLRGDELQKLRSAATRLDKLLQSAMDADREVLTKALARLDQLLAEIGTGKDINPGLKRS